jgi:archaellum component FlaC
MANTDKFKNSINGIASHLDDAITELENIETFYNTDNVYVKRTDADIAMHELLNENTSAYGTATQPIEQVIENLRANISILKRIVDTIRKDD